MTLTLPPHVHVNICVAICLANAVDEIICRKVGLAKKSMNVCGIALVAVLWVHWFKNASCQALCPLILWFGMKGGVNRSHFWVDSIANVFGATGCIFLKLWSQVQLQENRGILNMTCLAQPRFEILHRSLWFYNDQLRPPPTPGKQNTGQTGLI